jgi:hypothetical protein
LTYQKLHHVLISLLAITLFTLSVSAQSSSDAGSASPSIAASASPPGIELEKLEKPEKRLFGVVPNYRTANALIPFAPLTPRQKLGIATRDSFDWPTYPLAAVMTLAMPGKAETKAYGTGWSGFANRYVRNSADQIIGNMLTEGFLPILLREDPRYFRPGTGTLWSRLRSAVTQIAIARKDTGRLTFNTSEFLGNAIATGISNVYSPNLRSWPNSSEKLGLMIGTDMFSNVIKEFGPDLKERLLHRHHKG